MVGVLVFGKKAPKDREQGIALLWMVDKHMPRFPLDEAFRAGLPSELIGHFESWRNDTRHP